MTSTSSTMEFSQMDDLFGLSADLFAADLDTDGGILDFNFDGGLKHQNAEESLEDLLQCSSNGDPLGEEWMETLDLQTFMDNTASETAAQPVTEAPAPEPEIRKEGMKQAAFELLKALLTDQQPVRTDYSLDILQPVQPSIGLTASSPVAEVPNLEFTNSNNLDTLFDSVGDHVQSFTIQQDLSVNSEVVEIQPQTIFSQISGLESNSLLSVDDTFGSKDSVANSPLSNEDVESVILSSGPVSPYENLDTVDTSYLNDSEQINSVESSEFSDSQEFTRLKSKSKRNKAKSAPYDTDSDSVPDKRSRKKIQNKNAATRYRVKKKQEKDALQEQEAQLASKNDELKEKVESLRREIQYMKELMNEINKAKKSKI